MNESGEYLDPASEVASDNINVTATTDKDPKLLSLTHNPMHMKNDNFAFPFKGIGDNFHQEVAGGNKVEQTSSEMKSIQALDYTSMEQKNGTKEHIHLTKWEYNGLKVCGIGVRENCPLS